MPDFIFIIIILIFSVVIHEVSHGYAANALGDSTARFAGRLTLNPLKHLDLTGSVIIPAILILTQAGFIFGWAKPVPYNPYNLRNQRWGEAIVGGAGPAVYFLIFYLDFLILYHFHLLTAQKYSRPSCRAKRRKVTENLWICQ